MTDHMPIPEPVPLTASGTASMGNPDDETNRVARFTLPEPGRFLLVAILGKFTDGTGQADLTIHIDRKPSQHAGRFAYLLYEVPDIGTDGKQLHFHTTREERWAWIFEEGDEIVLKWTNPDSGNMSWVVEVRLMNATNLIQ